MSRMSSLPFPRSDDECFQVFLTFQLGRFFVDSTQKCLFAESPGQTSEPLPTVSAEAPALKSKTIIDPTECVWCVNCHLTRATDPLMGIDRIAFRTHLNEPPHRAQHRRTQCETVQKESCNFSRSSAVGRHWSRRYSGPCHPCHWCRPLCQEVSTHVHEVSAQITESFQHIFGLKFSTLSFPVQNFGTDSVNPSVVKIWNPTLVVSMQKTS